MLKHFKSGDFVSTERAMRISAALGLFYLVAVIALFATSDGIRDYEGRPLGTDFANVYAAGKMALEGDAVAALDPVYHLAKQREIFNDPDIPVYGWHYPPFFLMIAAMLAVLPYTAGYLVWQAATFPLYLRIISMIAPQRIALIAACAFPAVFVNFIHGQNGFLTAALLGGSMVLLDKRPFVAGVLIGLLAYKPQFGALIPFVLVATGRWRTIAGAATTIAALIAISTLAFGVEVWPAFLENMRFTNSAIVAGDGPGWEKVQSLYAALRHVGATAELAMTAQAALAIGIAVALVRLWRSSADIGVKAAGLIAGSLLATPYVLDYDMTALAAALAFLFVHSEKNGYLPWEKSLLALAWLAPLVSRQIAGAAFIPLCFIALCGVFLIAVRKGAGAAAPAASPLGNSQIA